MIRIAPLGHERLALVVLAGLYLVVAVGFALATPYGEAPDENAHLLYTEYMVRFGTLPPISSHFYTNEAIQPPLYYALNAAIVLTGRALDGNWASMAPIAPHLRGNPKLWQGIPGPYPVHLHPLAERWPFWPYVLRVVSIGYGLAVILLTYATARILVPPPASGAVALTATAFAALLPQANFIRASITNENLADFLAAAMVFVLVAELSKPASRKRRIAFAVLYALGLLTKLSLAPLLLPAVVVFWVRCPGPPIQRIRAMLPATGVIGILAGPFYLYRWVAYGDPFAGAAWQAMIPTDSPWHLTDLFWLVDPFRANLWNSFWGDYGWQRVPLPDALYLAFASLTGVAVLGGVILVARRMLTPVQWAGCAVFLSVLLLEYAVVIVISLRLIAWQGRELFPALSSVSVLFGFGLAGLVLGPLSTQFVRGSVPRIHRVAVSALLVVIGGLLAANIYSIIYVVAPILNSNGL
jgi:hypothetical protein